MRWVLNLVWAALLTAAAPWILWRMIREGRYRRGLRARLFGHLPLTSDARPRIWFHAVSVGELIQLQKVVDAFAAAADEPHDIIVSVSTDSAYDLAVDRLPHCQVVLCPLDFSWAVANAIRRIAPRALVLMELELWPNLIAECRRQHVPVALINARMSPRSVRGYRRVRRLLQPLFRSLTLVAAQSDEFADRFEELGVNPDAVVRTGSIKFDGVTTDRRHPQTLALRAAFALRDDDLVLVAGSTQAPEEEHILDIWNELKLSSPRLRLILVPRHPQRFDEVAALIERQGLSVLRRSASGGSVAGTSLDRSRTVGLLDSIGELSHCWGVADIAFVGGSFGTRGGQNMIEPAAFAAAVVFGPHTWNFRDVVRTLRRQRACCQVNSYDELRESLRLLVSDADRRCRMGQAARNVVLSNQGATERTVELIPDVLSGPGGASVSGPKVGRAA